MGVYIRGMEMPTKCADCLFIDYFKGQWYCHSINDILETGSSKRDERCNLVPVPPHGRLIDADALMREFEKAERTMAQHGQEYSCSFMSSSQEISTEWYCVEDMLENAPTIIEAEEGET